MRLSICTLLPLLLVFAASAVPTHACNIPVFRYALENWQPDLYQVFVLHQGELNEQQTQLVEQLMSASVNHQPAANLVVHSLRVDQLEETADIKGADQGRPKWPPGSLEYLSAWLKKTPLEGPTIAALYPRQNLLTNLAWHGALNEANVRQLIDSPLRQELAGRILEGQTAVWVLIESGNKEKDDNAYQTLAQQLSEMPEQVSLPDQSLIESDEQFRADTPIELKVEFSLIRVRRDDAIEQPIVSMLLGSEDDLRDFDEPIAVPVYGRGRTYFALVGRGINAETIQENCQFLCGACSCQVKQENPGVDLLFAMNWQDRIQGSAMPMKTLPTLTGVGAFELAASQPEVQDTSSELAAVDTTAAPVQTAEASGAAPAVGQDEAGSGGFERRLLLLIGALVAAGVVFVAGVTLFLRRGTDGR